MATPTKTPTKRGLPCTPGTPGTPTKRMEMVGYILHVTPIDSGYYFVQMQTDSNLSTKFIAYNRSMHPTFIRFKDTGEVVKVELRRNEENGRISFSGYCKVYPTSTMDVSFALNEELKQNIQKEDMCQDVTIAELKTMDAGNTTDKFNIKVRVSIGLDDFEEIVTQFGRAKIKRDVVVEDASGKLTMDVFENKLQKLKNGQCYQITHVQLKKYGQKPACLHLTADTRVIEIAAIKGLKKISTPTASTTRIEVDAFNSVRGVKVSSNCISCGKEIICEDPDATLVPCHQCGASNRKAKLEEKQKASAEVNFDVNGEPFWATNSDPILTQLVGKVVTASELMNQQKLFVHVDLDRALIKKLGDASAATGNDKENIPAKE